MILKAETIVHHLREGSNIKHDDPLVITPLFEIEKLEKSGSASVDLRLGTWFLTLKQARIASLEASIRQDNNELFSYQPVKSHHVPFGSAYILHPQSFVLGVTMEWMRIPRNMAGYVTAKSSWGRRGLIIATATGIHPGFKGCLTLELCNVGEIPIAITPGMTICQLFIHSVEERGLETIDQSLFACKRKPTLGMVRNDDVSDKLAKAHLLNKYQF